MKLDVDLVPIHGNAYKLAVALADLVYGPITKCQNIPNTLFIGYDNQLCYTHFVIAKLSPINNCT